MSQRVLVSEEIQVQRALENLDIEEEEGGGVGRVK